MDVEQGQKDRLLVLSGSSEVQWVGQWARSLPDGDEWATAVAQTMDRSAAVHVETHEVVLDLPPERWTDLLAYTEVAGGSFVVTGREHYDRELYALALPDTPPPELVSDPEAEPAVKRLALPAYETGWLLCWFRQHVVEHSHHSGVLDLIKDLAASVPASDEAMAWPLLTHIMAECWDSFVLFAQRHGLRVDLLPEDDWDNGKPVWWLSRGIIA